MEGTEDCYMHNTSTTAGAVRSQRRCIDGARPSTTFSNISQEAHNPSTFAQANNAATDARGALTRLHPMAASPALVCSRTGASRHSTVLGVRVACGGHSAVPARIAQKGPVALLSATAYHGGVERGIWQGSNVWLPLALDPAHFARAAPATKLALRKIGAASGLVPPQPSQPQQQARLLRPAVPAPEQLSAADAVTVMAALLDAHVVGASKAAEQGQWHLVRDSVSGFCHLQHTFLHVAKAVKGVTEEASRRLSGFLEAASAAGGDCRGVCLGRLLALLAVAPDHGPDEVLRTALCEGIRRAAYRAASADPRLRETLLLSSGGHHNHDADALLARTGQDVAASPALRSLSLHACFAACVARRGGAAPADLLRWLDAHAGAPAAEMVSDVEACARGAASAAVGGGGGWEALFACPGVPRLSEEELLRALGATWVEDDADGEEWWWEEESNDVYSTASSSRHRQQHAEHADAPQPPPASFDDAESWPQLMAAGTSSAPAPAVVVQQRVGRVRPELPPAPPGLQLPLGRMLAGAHASSFDAHANKSSRIVPANWEDEVVDEKAEAAEPAAAAPAVLQPPPGLLLRPDGRGAGVPAEKTAEGEGAQEQPEAQERVQKITGTADAAAAPPVAPASPPGLAAPVTSSICLAKQAPRGGRKKHRGGGAAPGAQQEFGAAAAAEGEPVNKLLEKQKKICGKQIPRPRLSFLSARSSPAPSASCASSSAPPSPRPGQQQGDRAAAPSSPLSDDSAAHHGMRQQEAASAAAEQALWREQCWRQDTSDSASFGCAAMAAEQLQEWYHLAGGQQHNGCYWGAELDPQQHAFFLQQWQWQQALTQWYAQQQHAAAPPPPPPQDTTTLPLSSAAAAAATDETLDGWIPPHEARELRHKLSVHQAVQRSLNIYLQHLQQQEACSAAEDYQQVLAAPPAWGFEAPLPAPVGGEQGVDGCGAAEAAAAGAHAGWWAGSNNCGFPLPPPSAASKPVLVEGADGCFYPSYQPVSYGPDCSFRMDGYFAQAG